MGFLKDLFFGIKFNEKETKQDKNFYRGVETSKRYLDEVKRAKHNLEKNKSFKSEYEPDFVIVEDADFEDFECSKKTSNSGYKEQKFYSVLNDVRASYESQCKEGLPECISGYFMDLYVREGEKNPHMREALKSEFAELCDWGWLYDCDACDKKYIATIEQVLPRITLVKHEWDEQREVEQAKLAEMWYRDYGAKYCRDYGMSLEEYSHKLYFYKSVFEGDYIENFREYIVSTSASQSINGKLLVGAINSKKKEFYKERALEVYEFIKEYEVFTGRKGVFDVDLISYLETLLLQRNEKAQSLPIAFEQLADKNGTPYRVSEYDKAVDGWYISSKTGAVDSKKLKGIFSDIKSFLNLGDDASMHFNNGSALISKGGFIEPEKEIYKSFDYDSAMLSREKLVYGLTYGNKPFAISFSDMTHMLIVGQSGSGKSVLQNWLAVQFLHNIDRLARLYLIDLKGGVEFFPYDGLHEKITTCSDFEQLEQAVNDACVEMDNRLQSMKERGLRKWDGERIVFMVDEYAQIKLSGVAFLGKDKAKLLDANLLRLSMLGRAAGIRLICGLQKCTTAEMDSAFKNNLQTQICFKVKDGLTVSNVFGDTEAVKEQGVNMLKLPKGRAFCSIDGHDDALVQFPFISDKVLNEFLTAFKE